MAQTKLANLINPEVIGASLEVKLVDLIKFSPIAQMGYELQGQAGNTLSIPVYAYIGDASDIGEGVAIDTAVLSATTSEVTVKKAGKAVEITDEALLSAYGQPQDEAERQLGIALASKIDNDVLTALGTIGAGMTHDASAVVMDKDVIADSLVLFGEDINEETYLFIAPAQYGALRKDANFVSIGNGQAVLSGEVGQLMGAKIVVSNKVKANAGVFTNFMVRSGAIGIEMKRDVMVEADRDILKKTNVLSADVHYVAYLRDASKAVKVLAKQ